MSNNRSLSNINALKGPTGPQGPTGDINNPDNLTITNNLNVGETGTFQNVYVTDKLTVDGLIDPTGLVLDPQASAPLIGSATIWAKDTGGDSDLMYTNESAMDRCIATTNASGDLSVTGDLNVSISGSVSGLIASGTWTPTYGTRGNLGTPPDHIYASYTRIGNIVSFVVTARLLNTYFGGDGASAFNFSLPVASTFISREMDASGTVSIDRGTIAEATISRIIVETDFGVANRIYVHFDPVTTAGTHHIRVSGQYIIR